MKKKVILSAGGTGGHLFPAQSLAHDLQALADWDILFVGGGLRNNRYFNHQNFSFEEIECATFSFSHPIKLIKGSKKIIKGVAQSRRILKEFKPDLIVGFGSFFTLPLLLAALVEKRPFILHEQNAIPGKVNRLFSSFAHTTTITFPSTRSFLKGKGRIKSLEVLFPMRKRSFIKQEDCWKYFGFHPSKLTLLVFGGSQGAAQLNTLFLGAVEFLNEIQVIHLTGNEERTLQALARYSELKIKAYVKPFEEHIDYAMQIADFAITRAGAATIAELVENKLPALLVPYPFATDNHQEENGLHFISQVKGGKMYKENELTAKKLAHILKEILPLRAELKKNIAKYKEGRQSQTLASLIESITYA